MLKPWLVVEGGGKEREKRNCGREKKNGDRWRGGSKERTGEKERGTDVLREGGGHRTRFGDAGGAFSRVLEVFLVTCRGEVALMEMVVTLFVTVEDLGDSGSATFLK